MIVWRVFYKQNKLLLYNDKEELVKVLLLWDI
jgi:hypothetical protein